MAATKTSGKQRAILRRTGTDDQAGREAARAFLRKKLPLEVPTVRIKPKRRKDAWPGIYWEGMSWRH